MTAVGHLATGLLLKARFRKAPLPLLLAAAVAPDVVWAVLNLVPNPGGPPIEITHVSSAFQYIGDQHLLLQPWSHSLLSVAALGGILATLAFVAFRQWGVAAAVLLAVLGHWGLDYLVHDADLSLWPGADALRVGPPFVLNQQDPTRGLAATFPGAAFVLQMLVATLSATAFLRAFPIERPRGRLWFSLGLLLMMLLALPLFIPGALAGRIVSTQGLIWAALGEMLVMGVLMATLARHTCGRFFPQSPLDDPGRQGVLFVRRLLATAALLAFAIAALHLLQGMLDAQSLPRVGATSTLLALLYIPVGRRFLLGNPSTLWLGIFLALLVAPIVRVAFGTGSLSLPLLALELGLGGLSLWLTTTLLTKDLLL